MIKYSIIIPVKAINDYVRETVFHIQALKNPNWELIILPNDLDQNEWNGDQIKIIPSGKVGPAAKRDLGAKKAKGEILVFLDDDSYPSSDLLDIASPYFDTLQVAAIGGPAITPWNDSFWQKVSGAVFLSKFSGGNPERYLPIGGVKEIYDWPSVNLMVRRLDFIEIGGFNSPYWPGEDTKLCLDLINKTSKKILYVPCLKVWHHRRSGMIAHLKQVGGYGLHRGYFSKVHPKTSRKIKYFLPSSLFLFTCATFFISLYPYEIKILFIFGWSIYAGALLKAFCDISKYETKLVAICTIYYIIATHQWYGYSFIKGLLTHKLVSKLR
jgi:glycosyltransferase involved in cell wall biosynthesis